MNDLQTLTKEERRAYRVQISMLHREANQLQDMPDDLSKCKARERLMEAEALRIMIGGKP